MDHKVNIRQLGHSIAKAHAELSALHAMLADQISQIDGRVTACEQKLSWGVASPLSARCPGHEWYQGACVHCNITVNEWRSRPPAQHEPLGNESAKLVGGV